MNGIRLVLPRSGVARCIEGILQALGELSHPFREVRVYTPVPLPPDITLPPRAVNVVLRSVLPNALWEQITLPRGHGRAGLLLCPSYVIPLAARCPTFLIHHGSYEGYPQAFGWWRLNRSRVVYALSAWRATAVSTVSEHSRRDMTRFYGLDSQRIHVVPEGVDTALFRQLHDSVRLQHWREAVLGRDVPFVLYVGKPTERRNLSSLIRAFAVLRAERGLPHHLLLVGTDLPGDSPYHRIIRECGVEARVTTLGHATPEELVSAYNAADLLVYPSSYEGFGMPVLEAMACGTPVIALNNTAFPEFAGGVAHLLPDARVETLARSMGSLLTDTEERRRMAIEGPKRAAQYDWHSITRRYLDVMIPLADRWACRGGAPA